MESDSKICRQGSARQNLVLQELTVVVPRALAGLGLVAMILQMTAVGMPLFGHDVIFPLLAPLGLCQLLLAVWLLSKGFRPRST